MALVGSYAMAQNANAVRQTFDYTTSTGNTLPTRLDRQIARRVGALRRVRRVSWYSGTSSIAAKPAHGVEFDRFTLSDVREILAELGADDHDVVVNDDKGMLVIQNTNRNDSRVR